MVQPPKEVSQRVPSHVAFVLPAEAAVVRSTRSHFVCTPEGRYILRSCDFFFNWFSYGVAPIHGSIGSELALSPRRLRSHGRPLVFAVILILRLYAMYDRSKTLLYGLLALLGVQLVAETIIIGPIVAHQKSKRMT